jgi:hypothetical protein
MARTRASWQAAWRTRWPARQVSPINAHSPALPASAERPLILPCPFPTFAGDKALGALATGAGSGFEARAAAGGDGAEIAAALNPLDLLHNCLVWRHIAPTAPDTLAAYPFVGNDPLAIDRWVPRACQCV